MCLCQHRPELIRPVLDGRDGHREDLAQGLRIIQNQRKMALRGMDMRWMRNVRLSLSALVVSACSEVRMVDETQIMYSRVGNCWVGSRQSRKDKECVRGSLIRRCSIELLG